MHNLSDNFAWRERKFLFKASILHRLQQNVKDRMLRAGWAAGRYKPS